MARSVQTATDVADFFVGSLDLPLTTLAVTVAVALNISATAGSTNNSLDQTNTLHKGAWFFLNVASISVNTATLAVQLNGKNPQGGGYITLARLSLDGITNGNANSPMPIGVYPGFTAPTQPAASGTNPISGVQGFSIPLPKIFQVQASLTITTTASQTGIVSYSISQSRIL